MKQSIKEFLIFLVKIGILKEWEQAWNKDNEEVYIIKFN
jgi:hypothetical protein